eukprot:8626150-Alexandrium_andersonii.AAC.1
MIEMKGMGFVLTAAASVGPYGGPVAAGVGRRGGGLSQLEARLTRPTTGQGSARGHPTLTVFNEARLTVELDHGPGIRAGSAGDAVSWARREPWPAQFRSSR